jgi:hypothetical protein
MTEETFVNYKNSKWMWATLLGCAVLTLAYFIHSPIEGRNGGTIYGIIVGILAAVAIFFLMWFGVRKRSYASAQSSLKGWLSAHIWIGFSLAYIVLLHCGFELGYNIHTLAYVLMVGTIISGLVGVINYRTLPYKTKSNRGGLSVKKLIENFETISKDIDRKSQSASISIVDLVKQLDSSRLPSLSEALFNSFDQIKQKIETSIDKDKATNLLSNLPEDQQVLGREIISLIHQKALTCASICEEAKVLALLKIWLYLHIPLSFGCVVALLIHIFSVLYYW